MSKKVEKNKFKIKGNLKRGDKFTLLETEWTIIEITDKGYKCLSDSIGKRMFDNDSNNWENATLRKYLNGEYYEELAAVVGEQNIIPFKRDLTSIDGLKHYGSVIDKVSIQTFDEYRTNRDIIPNVEDYWWWLLNAWSTNQNGWNYAVTVVSPSGCICDYGCYDCNGGVRPVCIFSSSIFESEE